MINRLVSLPSILAAVPIFLFFLGRLLENTLKFVRQNALEKMREDSREEVRRVGENKPLRLSIETYINYGSQVQQVFQNVALALVSLMISHYTCTKSLILLTLPHFILYFLLIAFIIFFLWKLAFKRLDPAAEKSSLPYRTTSLFLSFFVIVLQWVLGRFPELCSM